MMEAKEQEHAADTSAADAARKEDATSSDTLDDLEQTLEIGTTKPDTGSATSDTASVPAPDGTPDPDRGSDTSGDPM